MSDTDATDGLTNIGGNVSPTVVVSTLPDKPTTAKWKCKTCGITQRRFITQVGQMFECTNCLHVYPMRSEIELTQYS